MNTSKILISLSAVGALVLATACADTSWEGAKRANTVAAYHQFLRDNGSSPYAAEAEERIAYIRVKTAKTIATFEAFESDYPGSTLLGDLRGDLEPRYFERARLANSPTAYRAFLSRYPNGAMTRRAIGNLSYVETVRDHPTVGSLREFTESHPESDFAAEAQGTLDLFEFRRQTHIQKMGVRVDVAPNIAQPTRVRRGFSSVVARHYRELGVEVTMIEPGNGATPDMDAWMRVDYEEAPASGVFGGSTLISRCRVRLYHTSSEEPIWDHTFEAPAEHILKGAYGRDKTVFGNSRYKFWKEFFVPLSTWATSSTRVTEKTFLDEVTAIDIRGDRAALLFHRGGFNFLDVSSPASPVTLHRYRREHDLSRWEGVKVLRENLVLIYGPDGIEIVEMRAQKPKRLAKFEIHEIGVVNAADIFDSTLIIGSSKGVYAFRLDAQYIQPHRLLEGEYVGVEIDKPYIYLVRPDRVEVTSPKHLLRHLTGSRVGLGKGFDARLARRFGDSLFVIGRKQAVELTLAKDPARPLVVSQLDPEVVGQVADMTTDDGHLFLLGERGLQVAGQSGQWVADSIQVDANHAMARKGRFLFLVGNRKLEVLDLGAYSTAPASPAR